MEDNQGFFQRSLHSLLEINVRCTWCCAYVLHNHIQCSAHGYSYVLDAGFMTTYLISLMCLGNCAEDLHDIVLH